MQLRIAFVLLPSEIPCDYIIRWCVNACVMR